MSYSLTIWLEIHCKLLTDSKVFCRCRNEQDFDTLPANTHVCPVCMWLPWALPTLSYDALKKAWALWKLLWCVQQDSYFDRKSYFYPDLPMWYQITQFSKPLNIVWKVIFHSIDYSTCHSIDITQAHLECDTAKSALFEWNTLLDYNRAGTPLVEIVTAPWFHSIDEVHGFIREIQRTLQYYSISDAEMDKGQMRCDVNISISNSDKLWTKVEIKNMNSISAIKKAIEFEYKRQSDILDSWWILQQETRWRDDTKGISYTMRTKENALDYRYFPEPDLPTVIRSTALDNEAKNITWETIAEKIIRYKDTYGFNKEYINGILSNKSITYLFETCVTKWFDPKTVAKYIVNYVLAYTNVWTLHIDNTSFSSTEFMIFLDLIQKNNTPDNIAKKILTTYLETRESVATIFSKSSNVDTNIDIDTIIHDILIENAKVVEEYKWGKSTAIGFLIWQAMKKTWGAMQPQAIKEKLENALSMEAI